MHLTGGKQSYALLENDNNVTRQKSPNYDIRIIGNEE
jgi:hypothetical protein